MKSSLLTRAFLAMSASTVVVLGLVSPPAQAATVIDASMQNAGRVPQSVAAGGYVSLNVEVRGSGPRGATMPRNLTVSLLLSTDSAIGGDTLIKREFLPTAIMGRPGTQRIVARIPTATSPRFYRMVACVGGIAGEPRYWNNCKLAAGAMRVLGTPTPPPPVTPPGVVLVPQATAVTLPTHHFAAGVYDNAALAKEVVVTNRGATTSGPLTVDYPAGVTENCGLGSSSPCVDLNPEPCMGATLATGEKCSMLLAFEPDRLATLNASLTVRDRTRPLTGQTPARIQLTGQTTGGAYFVYNDVTGSFARGVPGIDYGANINVLNIGNATGSPGALSIAFPNAYFRLVVLENGCTGPVPVDGACTITARIRGGAPATIAPGVATGSFDFSGPGNPGQIRLNVT